MAIVIPELDLDIPRIATAVVDAIIREHGGCIEWPASQRRLVEHTVIRTLQDLERVQIEILPPLANTDR